LEDSDGGFKAQQPQSMEEEQRGYICKEKWNLPSGSSFWF
jgi:hypothetical protein